MLTSAFFRFYLRIILICLCTSHAFCGTSSGLVLWNQLGSTSEVQISSVGLGGTMNAGQFVEGKFGYGVELTVLRDVAGVTFPITAVPTLTGCIEFWMKLVGFPSNIPAGPNPALLTTDPAPFVMELAFAPNDGNANGGLYINNSLGWVGTGAFGSWTYAAALNSPNVAEWHHIALVWKGDGNIPGVPQVGRKIVTYIDGKLNTANGTDNANHNYLHNLTSGRLCLMGRSTTAITGASVVFDNLKIWDYAKTDFSDRFDEDSGVDPVIELHIMSPHGDSEPACGINRFLRGDMVEAYTSPIQTLGPSRLVCTGWLGTGSTPISGTSNRVSFLIETNSSLAWYWSTECLLNVQAGTGGTSTGTGWYTPGALVQITANPADNYRFLRWSDNSSESSRQVVIPLTGATYSAEFQAITTGTAKFRSSSIRVEERTGAVILTIERIGGASGPASVSCEPHSQTAKAGSDFTSAIKIITWADGDASAKQIRIPIIVDRVAEGDETFSVVLTNPVGITIGQPDTAIITILAWPSFMRPSGATSWIGDLKTESTTPVK